MKKKLLSSAALAALACSIGVGAYAAEADKVEVKLTIGKAEAVVGGQALPVKPPVIVNNSTLVPLRVISAAFASDPQWLPDTQGIVLTYGGKTIELTIDSVVSTVNGEKRNVPSAPKLIDGTTMVPVRFISETFGAEVSFQDEGGVQSIAISGSLAEGTAPSEEAPVIDGDEGKTKIGDSHWGWTMNYPSGLVQDFQALNGEWIYFSDANGEYGIDIEVDTTQPKMKESGLLAALTDTIYDGTILDKRLVQSGPVPYAKVVSRSSAGSYLENRLYLKDGVLFWYGFEAYDEANYKNQAKMRVYQDLIDSFEVSFDAADDETKDVSSVKDGYIQHKDDVYGIAMELPASWTASSDTTGLNFYAADGDLSMYFTMNSLEKGDTLEAWAQRHEKRFAQELLPAYREIGKLPDTKVDGARALVRLWSERADDSSDWTDTYDVYVIKGGYKYNFSFFYGKDNRDESRPTIERIIESIRIDESVAENNFGYLDDAYGIDMDATTEIVNEVYGYSFNVPSFWTEGYYNSDESYTYEYRGGSLTIEADDTTTYKEAVASEEDNVKFAMEYDSTTKIVENVAMTFKGVPAKKIVLRSGGGEGSLVSTTYVLEKNKVVYTIRAEELQSSRTPENIKRMNDAIDSLTFE
ncbi:stalk domain-containing protein [Paenibacillus sp.]|uniref:stalk domain-containing protein n=1 Tax=Paenibacillus sp. TaxID=58172 RepID=UPI0028113B2F|nr:stalk domain-containing protein [Paenibacillus sp.]